MKSILPSLFAGVALFAMFCAIDATRGVAVMVSVNVLCGVVGAVVFAVTAGRNL